jgi:flagellin
VTFATILLKLERYQLSSPTGLCPKGKNMSLGFSTLSTEGFLRGIRNGFSLFDRAAQQISSGLLINSASDNPAGLIASEQMRAQIGSIGAEIDNVSALIDKYDYASSNLQGLRSQLVELRGLAVSAANEGGNDAGVQSGLSAIADHIVASYNRQLDNAEYNGANLFDGSEGSLTKLAPVNGIDLSTTANAEASISKIDSAIAELDKADIDIGSAVRYDLNSRQHNLELSRENLIPAESRIRDVDYARAIVDMIRGEMQARASMSLLSHSFMTESLVMNLFSKAMK